MKILLRWLKSNSVMLINAGSLIGTNVMTSGLGFAFWAVAARLFSPDAVGIASASISSMTLIGSFCILGLGTLLITEIPRQSGNEGPLISTALVIVCSVSGCIGLLFAIGAPLLSASFKPLGATWGDSLIFASGVALTSTTTVLDQALVGLLLGKVQFWRNTLFAVVKLLALFLLVLWMKNTTGMDIYAVWALGNVASVLLLASILLLKKGWNGKQYLPDWGLLRKLGSVALQHHFLNITLQLPTSALPVLVALLLSARMNAWFYVSWMIVSFLFFVPVALTMVLHAMNSAQQSTLARKARTTIMLSFLINLFFVILLQVTAQQLLGLFGKSYADQATPTLHILMFAGFPLVIKNHYISICRIFDRLKQAMVLISPGGFFELGAAALGAKLGGLLGLSTGWVLALCIEAVIMFPTVYKAIWAKTAPSIPVDMSNEDDAWLITTLPIPAFAQSYETAQAVWQMNTLRLASVRPTTDRKVPARPVPVRPVLNEKELVEVSGRLHRRNKLGPTHLQRYEE